MHFTTFEKSIFVQQRTLVKPFNECVIILKSQFKKEKSLSFHFIVSYIFLKGFFQSLKFWEIMQVTINIAISIWQQGFIGSSLSTGFQVYLSKCWDPVQADTTCFLLGSFCFISVDLVTTSLRLGPTDPKYKLNISSFLTLLHLADCLICTRNSMSIVLLL